MAAQGQTDWTRFDATTDEQIDASVRDDPDAPPIVDDAWFAAAVLINPASRKITVTVPRPVPPIEARPQYHRMLDHAFDSLAASDKTVAQETQDHG